MIFVERLLFDNEVKESLNNTFERSGIKVEYYVGFIVIFDKAYITWD